MSEFTPSPLQQAIFDAVANPEGGNLVIEAVAGSGKTTTIVRACALMAGSAVFLAFNKNAADEIASRFAELGITDKRASTFHSLGWGALLRYAKGRTGSAPKIDGKKSYEIVDWVIDAGHMEKDVALAVQSAAVQLVSLAKQHGVGYLAPDRPETWRHLMDHFGVEVETEGYTDEQAVLLARMVLKRSVQVGEQACDFDDMIYLPLLWNLRLFQNDWVVIDEAQDTNPVRRALAKRALRAGGRLVAVGDPHQAIYGFTGASADAMDLIRKEFSCRVMPLSVSFRCPRAVVAEARKFVPHIEPHPGAPEGEVTVIGALRAADLRPTDAVLCRNTAPLVEAAYRLIGQKVGCRVLGREIGAGLIKLIKNQKAKTVPILLERLAAWRGREVAKWAAKGQEGRAQSAEDRVQAIEVLASQMPAKSGIADLVRVIESMFDDGHNGGLITLSTVHKAKGLEWDRVVILEPSLMPSKWARQEWQKAQEVNLQYVAVTRAKATLVMADVIGTAMESETAGEAA